MFHFRPDRSRANAPYRDRIEDDGRVLIYGGHDVAKNATTPDAKSVDHGHTPSHKDEMELRLGAAPGPLGVFFFP
jgi:hypothetical protein